MLPFFRCLSFGATWKSTTEDGKRSDCTMVSCNTLVSAGHGEFLGDEGGADTLLSTHPPFSLSVFAAGARGRARVEFATLLFVLTDVSYAVGCD
jgi:hypothetical protein